MNEPNDQQRDQADMERLVAGHDAALNDLMERHAPKLLNYLSRSLQNDDDAADLAQETFVRVYQNRHKFNSRQKFSTWLFTIATNLVRDRFRYRARHPQVSLDAEIEATGTRFAETIPATNPCPRDELLSGERAQAVRTAIAALPEELRTSLILSEYEELPNAAIADILHCTTKAVETRIYRARRELRQRLSAFLRIDSTPG